ncbi:MAG: hypothetical protein U0V72_03885 [Cytophagales bacterium]
MKHIIIILLVGSFWLCKATNFAEQQAAKNTPDTVKIGTYIMNIYDINFKDKEYSIKFWVWMKYKNPVIDFANTIEIPGSKNIDKPDIMNYVDSTTGEILTLMKVNCVINQSWSVEDYPFDEQKLNLRIENNKYDTRYVVFVKDKNNGELFDPLFNVDGWKLNNHKQFIDSHTYKSNFGDESLLPSTKSNYATYNLEFEIGREASGLFLKLFVGMYIAFLISCVSFLIHADHAEPRFSLPVGALFAAVGNKYIIDSILPESNSFTLVDTLHTLTFISIFVTITISSLSLIFYGNNNLDKSNKFDKWGGIISISIYVMLNIIFISKAMQ